MKIQRPISALIAAYKADPASLTPAELKALRGSVADVKKRAADVAAERAAEINVPRLKLVGLIAGTGIVSMTNATAGNWVAAGCPRNANGTFNLVQVCAWLAAERRKKELKEDDELLRGPDSPNLEAYRGWRAKNEELEFRRKSGETVSVEDVKREWAIYGSRLRTGLESIGKAHGPVVANDIASVVNEVFNDIDRAHSARTAPRNGRRVPAAKTA